MGKDCESAVALAEAQRRKIGRLQAENARLKRRLAKLENDADTASQRPQNGSIVVSEFPVSDRVPVKMSAAEYRRLVG